MLAEDLQPSKAPSSPSQMAVTDSGKVMIAKELQPAKADFPMSVTDSGIAMLAKELQPSKAAVRIAVTEGWWRLPKTCTLQSGKVPNGLHWLRDCDLYRIRDIVMLLKDLQPQQARIPMSVTDSRIVMLSKEMAVTD